MRETLCQFFSKFIIRHQRQIDFEEIERQFYSLMRQMVGRNKIGFLNVSLWCPKKETE